MIPFDLLSLTPPPSTPSGCGAGSPFALLRKISDATAEGEAGRGYSWITHEVDKLPNIEYRHSMLHTHFLVISNENLSTKYTSRLSFVVQMKHSWKFSILQLFRLLIHILSYPFLHLISISSFGSLLGQSRTSGISLHNSLIRPSSLVCSNLRWTADRTGKSAGTYRGEYQNGRWMNYE